MATERPIANRTILKVLVGSQAHGLAAPGSDADYRSVFVMPTAEMFRLGFKYQGARMTKEGADETAWEVGQFLLLGTQCHPLILETFVAPVVAMDDWGTELRRLFPHVWSPQTAYDAFINYCENQRRKMLDKKDERPEKYAAAYLRVLFNLCELLERETFSVRIAETPMGETIRKIKEGNYRTGEVIDLGEYWTQEAQRRLAHCTHRSDLSLIDDFLVRLRKAFLA
jgi:predicted nucleotidyltransferase